MKLMNPWCHIFLRHKQKKALKNDQSEVAGFEGLLWISIPQKACFCISILLWCHLLAAAWPQCLKTSGSQQMEGKGWRFGR